MVPATARGTGLARSGDAWSGGGALAQHTGHVPQQPAGTSPLQKIHAILRGRYLLAGVLGVLGLSAGAATGWYSQDPTYLGRSSVEIRPVTEDHLGRKDGISFYDNYIRSEALKFQTQDVANYVVATDAWRRTKMPAEAGEFINGVVAKYNNGTFFIDVTYEHPDPGIATAAAEAAVTGYSAFFKANRMTETQDNLARLRTDEQKKRELVKRLQDRIAELCAKHGVTPGILEGQQGGLLTRVQELQAQLDGTRLQLKKAKAVVEASTGEEPSIPEPDMDDIVAIDRNLQDLLQQQQALQLQVWEAENSGLGANHPTVQRLRARVGMLDEQMKAQIDVAKQRARLTVGPAAGGLTYSPRMLGMLELEETIVMEQLAETSRRAQVFGSDLVEINRIQGEIEREQDEMRRIADTIAKIESRDPSAGFLAGYTVQGPVVSDDARKKMAMAGGMAGFAFPVGIVMLIGLLDSRFRYSDDAAGQTMSGLTLLGILPNLPDRLSDPSQASVAAHCVHQIRTMLQLNAGDNAAAYAVTSATSGDGKTSLCLALGLSYAASGSRTLLIDTDLVGGGLSNRLGREEQVGILEAVTEHNLPGYVRRTDVEDLSILPVGNAGVQHAGVFSPAAMKRLIAEAKRHYDVVIVDTGPILGSIEATPTCAAVDGVILTVSRGQQRPMVEKAVAHLRGVGAKVAGVVFNRANTRDFERSVAGISMTSASRSTASAAGGHNHPLRRELGPVAQSVAKSAGEKRNGNSNAA
ncbi:MAG: AAA family ATPase [Phycisphaerae bacterium]